MKLHKLSWVEITISFVTINLLVGEKVVIWLKWLLEGHTATIVCLGPFLASRVVLDLFT